MRAVSCVAEHFGRTADRVLLEPDHLADRAGDSPSFNFGWDMVIIALGVNASGLVLSVLALARPGHVHGQRPRRSMAWTAIGLSLVSFAGLGLILKRKYL